MRGTGNKSIVVLCSLDQIEAQQWRHSQIKPTCAVGRQKSCQAFLLLCDRHVSPIPLFPGQFNMLVDDLQRLLQAIPEKGGAQDGMTYEHMLPCLAKDGCIKWLINGAHELAEIHVWL